MALDSCVYILGEVGIHACRRVLGQERDTLGDGTARRGRRMDHRHRQLAALNHDFCTRAHASSPAKSLAASASENVDHMVSHDLMVPSFDCENRPSVLHSLGLYPSNHTGDMKYPKRPPTGFRLSCRISRRAHEIEVLMEANSLLTLRGNCECTNASDVSRLRVCCTALCSGGQIGTAARAPRAPKGADG